MKTQITVIIIFFFCLLWPTGSVGKTGGKKPAISYVARMKKKNDSVKKKSKPSYVNSQKNKPTKSKPSFVKNHRSRSPGLSYVQKMKRKKPAVKASVNKVRRTTMVFNPIKKTSKRIFSATKSATSLDFASADYRAVKKWAEDQGKMRLIKCVLKKYGAEIKALAAEFGIDWRVIVAICAHESGGDPNVTSSANAKGLMQLKPITAATYGLPNSSIYDPHRNLRAGTRYFSAMLKLFGNVKDALYAYGWGQTRARKGLQRGVKSDNLRGVQEVLYLTQIQTK